MADWFDYLDIASLDITDPHVESALRIGLILLLAWTLLLFSRRLIRLFKGFALRKSNDAEDQRRVETLARVFRYFTSILITIVAGMLILSELGVSIAPILGAAGVVGIAVGFGAQSVVKDFFNGFMILLENQIRHGDVVQVGGKSGLVEEVTLRYVRLRAYDGSVHFVPTGLIDVVTNMTLEYAYALVEIGVAYREDVDEVFAVMRRTAAELRDDPLFGPKIIEDLDIAGVENWADSAVMLRCRFKCVPLEQWNVRRELLRRLKAAFGAAGIEIPYPHLTLYPGRAKDGSAPALRVALDGDRAAPR